MTSLNEFQDAIVDIHTQRPDPLTYAILGIAGEAGEVAEAYNKALREMEPEDIPDDGHHRLMLALELGDVLRYTAKVAKLLGYSLQEIADLNTAKLATRKVPYAQ